MKRRRRNRVSRKWLAVAAGISLAAICDACRTVVVEKHDHVVVQVESNRWIVVEGGWEAKYRSYGVFTNLGRLEIDLTTNRAVRVCLDDLTTDVSSNHVYVITATGTATGEVVKKAIEGLK